jgi:DNA-binding transcriptional MocR family regulator
MEALIERGTFAPGARLPSVRGLSRQWQVSISTVLAAYRLLEDRGVIEARPQSGYYATSRFPEAAEEPEISRPALGPTEVSVGEVVMMVVRDTRDPSLVQLGAAVPDPVFLPVAKLNRLLAATARRQGNAAAGYDPPPGCEALRIQIARRALTAGCALTPHEIVTTSGCQEALLLCLRGLCRPGDTVAVESPTYYGLLQALEVLGLRAVEIPSHPRDGISLEALHYALETSPIRACLVISNFSNPLGSCMPDEKKRQLVAMLARCEVPLIEDDIYGDLYFGSERPKVAKAFDRKGLVLLCSSFSKTLSSGYRVGWVAPGRFQAEIERQKFVNTLATATLPQMAIAEFLEVGGYDRHLRSVRRAYARQVAQMGQAVSRVFPPGTRVTRPAGGFLLWVEMPLEVDSLQLYERALQSGITLTPGPLFSATGKYRHCVRLNAAYWSPGVEAAVVQLGRIAHELLDPTAYNSPSSAGNRSEKVSPRRSRSA